MKKLLATFFFLLIIRYSVEAKTKRVEIKYCEDIELIVSLSDTIVRFGDRISINLLFKNQTDKDLKFFPIAQTYLDTPFVAFGIDNDFILNNITDHSVFVWLTPWSDYSVNYSVIIGGTRFQTGENKFSVSYFCRGVDKNSPICSLSSSEFSIFVR